MHDDSQLQRKLTANSFGASSDLGLGGQIAQGFNVRSSEFLGVERSGGYVQERRDASGLAQGIEV